MAKDVLATSAEVSIQGITELWFMNMIRGLRNSFTKNLPKDEPCQWHMAGKFIEWFSNNKKTIKTTRAITDCDEYTPVSVLLKKKRIYGYIRISKKGA